MTEVLYIYEERPRQYMCYSRNSEGSNWQKMDCLRASVQVQLMAVLLQLYFTLLTLL